ncbi:I78 family peptidase inhibitor [Pollutimonas bauzanensis]|uniref:Peptidase inhibitor I78 family protein n=1 Tax=Pollutimonas bauzanensis TaxID=658167 RepID=A0A1M5Z4P5_9BURK|nr:I78 family peptidase inhibitor [Pollutimonas bauzanensis]SHI18853.1 Peptidase inhibitor I78 family protein [Pollutimonas bauzanensis]
MIRTLASAALLAGLAACAAPDTNAPAVAAGACNAEPAHVVFGRSITPALEQEALQATGAQTVRVLRPGQVITREYMAGRLNLQLNSDNVVVRANCG